MLISIFFLRGKRANIMELTVNAGWIQACKERFDQIMCQNTKATHFMGSDMSLPHQQATIVLQCLQA